MDNDASNFTKYIQFRNTYPKKIAFSFVVKTGSQETDEYIKQNGGQYRTELKANSTDDGMMLVRLTNGNTPYLAVGYLRMLGNDEVEASQPYEGCDDNRYNTCLLCKLKPRPSCINYDKNASVPAVQGKSSLTGQSTAQLESTILANLQANLSAGALYNHIDKYEITLDKVTASRNGMPYTDEAKPNTLYIYYHNAQPASSYLFADNFTNLNIAKVVNAGKQLLHFKREMDYNHGNSDYVTALFVYNFGPNDENFIQLQNAIEALKNPGHQTSLASQKVPAGKEQPEPINNVPVKQHITQENIIKAIETYNIGAKATAQEDWETAEKQFRAALLINPELQEAKKALSDLITYKTVLFYNEGIAAFNNKNLELAEEKLNQALTLTANHLESYLGLYSVLAAQDQILTSKMNALGNTKQGDATYVKLKNSKKALYKKVIPVCKKLIVLDQENQQQHKVNLKTALEFN